MLTQFRDPNLSIWQSAINESLHRETTLTEIEELKARLDFGDLDPCYVEVYKNYLKYFYLMHKSIPYVEPKNPKDSVETLPENCKIALVGDWGTGEEAAQLVMERIAQHNPDIVIHLGDIYYSGTIYEADNYFLRVVNQVFQGHMPRILTLAGNHDMYAGGSGYYWLLKSINQRASYFCLKNNYWNFIGVDTGYNDHDPFTTKTDQTCIQDKELAWLKAQVTPISKAKTVLLSHHPLFTAYDYIDNAAVNNKLLYQIFPLAPQITRWYWAHEHNQVIYKPWSGITARLIGHGAFPVAMEEAPVLKHSEVPFEDISLGNNGVCFNHGYVLISLSGPSAQADHYECQVATDKLNYSEQLN